MSVIAAQCATSKLYGSIAAVKSTVDSAVASGVDLGKCDGQVVSCRAALTAADDALALSCANNLLARPSAVGRARPPSGIVGRVALVVGYGA